MDKKSRLFHFEGCDAGKWQGLCAGGIIPQPIPLYVTWACYDDKNGQRQYEWGHYGNDLAAMEQDFSDRIKDYQRLYHVGDRADRGPRPLQVLLYPAACGHRDIPQTAPQCPG